MYRFAHSPFRLPGSSAEAEWSKAASHRALSIKAFADAGLLPCWIGDHSRVESSAVTRRRLS